MSDIGVRVTGLLPDTFKGMESAVKNELSKDPATSIASKFLGLIGSAATDAIRNRLNFDVVELLGCGWVVAQELHEYKDRQKHPPNETSIVYLGQHKMKTDVHPVVIITIGPMRREIPFTLELTAQINSVALSIRDGHITGAGTGDCFVQAQLKCGDTPLHDPLKSRKVTLPGRHDFQPPGLEIVV
jgi:hypothetical protein